MTADAGVAEPGGAAAADAPAPAGEPRQADGAGGGRAVAAEATRYAGVGAIAAAVHLSAQWAWHDLAGLPPWLAFWAAFAVAFAATAPLHHRWTFRSQRPMPGALARFLAAQVVGTAANFAVFSALLVPLGPLPHGHLLAVVASTALVTGTVFLVSRRIFA